MREAKITRRRVCLHCKQILCTTSQGIKEHAEACRHKMLGKVAEETTTSRELTEPPPQS